ESLAFLIGRRPPGALARLNLLLRRLGRPAVAQIPEASGPQTRSAGLDVVRGRLAASSAALWAAVFCVMLSFYFVLSWTPKLLVNAGLRPDQGISGGVLLNVGGIVGGVVLGLLAARVGPFRIVALTALAGAVAVVVFGWHGWSLAPKMAL